MGGWPARVARLFTRSPGVVVQHHELNVATSQFPRLRIAFASDFHASPTTMREVLDSSFNALRDAKPDVLLLGGDFICLDARFIDQVAEHLGDIAAPLGRYAVLGNHDLWVDYHYIERKLEAAGIQMLTNANMRLPGPHDSVWLCGLDDHWSGTPDAHSAFRGADGTRVVLMHQPSGLLDIRNERFDVAFCGHTHGGQIALPGGRAIALPQGSLSRTYPAGRYDLSNQRTLIVSRGVGCSTVPFRMFAPADVIVCDVTGEMSPYVSK